MTYLVYVIHNGTTHVYRHNIKTVNRLVTSNQRYINRRNLFNIFCGSEHNNGTIEIGTKTIIRDS